MKALFVIRFRPWFILAVTLGVAAGPTEIFGDSNVGRAKDDVLALEKAVAAYQQRNGKLPAKLEVLAELDADGYPAYIKKTMLIDPWGRPYGYDPRQLHNSTTPLIWSLGPDPADPSTKIQNWGGPPEPSLWDKTVATLLSVLPLLATIVGLLALAFLLFRYAKAGPADQWSRQQARLWAEFLVFVVCFGVFFALAMYLLMPRFLV
jgi:hypothetical protein